MAQSVKKSDHPLKNYGQKTTKNQQISKLAVFWWFFGHNFLTDDRIAQKISPLVLDFRYGDFKL